MRVMSAECPMGGGCPMSVKGVTGNPLFSFRSTSELSHLSKFLLKIAMNRM